MDSLDDLLQRVFRLSEFRPHQREIVEDVLAGNDVVCVMPTGAGKSLCFQLPAVLLKGLTVVVSPSDLADGRPGPAVAGLWASPCCC